MEVAWRGRRSDGYQREQKSAVTPAGTTRDAERMRRERTTSHGRQSSIVVRCSNLDAHPTRFSQGTAVLQRYSALRRRPRTLLRPAANSPARRAANSPARRADTELSSLLLAQRPQLHPIGGQCHTWQSSLRSVASSRPTSPVNQTVQNGARPVRTGSGASSWPSISANWTIGISNRSLLRLPLLELAYRSGDICRSMNTGIRLAFAWNRSSAILLQTAVLRPPASGST